MTKFQRRLYLIFILPIAIPIAMLVAAVTGAALACRDDWDHIIDNAKDIWNR